MKKENDKARITIKYLKTNETFSQLLYKDEIKDSKIIETVEHCIYKLEIKNL